MPTPTKVYEAHDLGVTEMLAKPFSLDTVAQRLQRVIERPRQFAQAPAYFGPNRRRQRSGPPPELPDRRITTREQITVHYGE